MKNELSIIKIGGHNFHFEEAGFRNSEPPFNLLAYDQMDTVRIKTSGNRVKRFMYDSDDKCIVNASNLKYPIPNSIQYMEVPDVFDRVVDEPSVKIMFKVMEYKLSGIYTEDTFFKARTMAMKNIFETSFIVDTQNLELFESLNKANKISFDHLKITEGNNKIFFDYNLKTRNIAAPTDDQDVIVIAILPSLEELDPQGHELLTNPNEPSLLSLSKGKTPRGFEAKVSPKKRPARNCGSSCMKIYG